MPERSEARVAIVHDYLSQRGGAERVALAMLDAFPGARLVTSVYEPDQTFQDFRRYDVEVLGVQRVQAVRRDPRVGLPLLPFAFGRAVLEDVDIVLCSSSGFAHGVRTLAPKVVYCHNPARWLYQTDEYLPDLPRAARAALRVGFWPLRRWDEAAALGASRYLVNSRVVRDRVRTAYGIEPALLPPPVAVDPLGRVEAVPGVEPGYLLTVGRLRGYKNTTVVAEAVERLPDERLVAVGGLPDGVWPDRLVALKGVSDGQLRWLYQNAAALVAASFEDFGLTPVEAYSHGTPAITLDAGGYLDTKSPAVSGPGIPAPPTTEGVVEAILEFRSRTWDRELIKEHAKSWDLAHFRSGLYSVVNEVLADPRSYAERNLATRRLAGHGNTVIRADRRRGSQPVSRDRRAE